MRWAGAADPDGKMPSDLRFTYRGREVEAARAVRAMLAWRPRCVILSHGRWYAENGEAELRRAFRWLPL